jgi:hypothetical protein
MALFLAGIVSWTSLSALGAVVLGKMIATAERRDRMRRRAEAQQAESRYTTAA